MARKSLASLQFGGANKRPHISCKERAAMVLKLMAQTMLLFTCGATFTLLLVALGD